MGVFVDQAAQDGFSADLLCLDAGHGGAGSVTSVVIPGHTLDQQTGEFLISQLTPLAAEAALTVAASPTSKPSSQTRPPRHDHTMHAR